MTPTMEFRWLRLSGGSMGFTHPMSIPWGDSRYYHVLQQKWVSVYAGEPDEWRDIPIVAGEK